MFIQLPEEKKSLIFPLFKNRQPNTSALWCYFDGILPGKTFVDDIKVPTKTICKLDMSWVYISDNADFEWIEDTLREIIKHAWIQVVWVLERGSKENFLKIAFGFYAIENGEICSESEVAFTARGYAELGIITDDDKQRKGFAFAVCVRTLEEIDKRGLTAIWACDVENIPSMKLAEKLGFTNPVKYNFIFFPQKNETVDIRKKIKN